MKGNQQKLCRQAKEKRLNILQDQPTDRQKDKINFRKSYPELKNPQETLLGARHEKTCEPREPGSQTFM